MSRLRFGRQHQSLAGRVTALSAIAVGLSVAVLSLAAYVTVRHQMYSALDSSLMARATSAAGANISTDLANNSIPSWMLSAANVEIALVTSDGQVISADRDPLGIAATLGAPEVTVAAGDAASSIRSVDTPSGPFRVIAVPTSAGGEALVIAQSLAPTEQTLHDMGLVMFFLGAIGVLFAAGAGALVARNALKPVRQLTDAFEEVARTEELTPIEVSGDDELSRLATAFNAMLASLSASRDLQSQLVSDASHELRTPLTSMRTNIDLLHQAEIGEGLDRHSRRELLDDLVTQISELSDLIGSLAELARGDSTFGSEHRVELHDALDRALQRARDRSPELTFEVQGDDSVVPGEASALEKAFGNLLDNAATWSPPHGTVWVTLREGRLTVEDEGPGVAEEDVPHIFDRFYRAKESRGLPGSGLGLSIVRHVVERHGGSVGVSPSPHGGAAFVIQLPVEPDPPSQGAERGLTGSIQ